LIFWIAAGGPVLFAVLIAVVCVICLIEYFGIVVKGRRIAEDPVLLFAFPIAWGILYGGFNGDAEIVLRLFTGNLIIAGSLALLRFQKDPESPWVIARQAAGLVYIPLLLSYLIRLRNHPAGVEWVFFLLCLVFAGDIGAYYAGRRLGRTKFCPWVSPKKTVAGALGGLFANLLIGGVAKAIFLPSVPWRIALFLFLSAGIFGQLGDLFESAMKRAAAVKDSGKILPGHGGLLDRIDALLFAAPVAYWFQTTLL
jgi:phosphatidate cytidylyltransferase